MFLKIQGKGGLNKLMNQLMTNLFIEESPGLLNIFNQPSLPNPKSYGAELFREGSPPPPFMCHMLPVTSHLSLVTCRVSHFVKFFFVFIYLYSEKVVKLFAGGSVINRAYPV